MQQQTLGYAHGKGMRAGADRRGPDVPSRTNKRPATDVRCPFTAGKHLISASTGHPERSEGSGLPCDPRQILRFAQNDGSAACGRLSALLRMTAAAEARLTIHRGPAPRPAEPCTRGSYAGWRDHRRAAIDSPTAPSRKARPASPRNSGHPERLTALEAVDRPTTGAKRRDLVQHDDFALGFGIVRGRITQSLPSSRSLAPPRPLPIGHGGSGSLAACRVSGHDGWLRRVRSNFGEHASARGICLAMGGVWLTCGLLRRW